MLTKYFYMPYQYTC